MRNDDDTTLNNAGPAGRALADELTTRAVSVIDEFTDSRQQRVAVARLVADGLYNIDDLDGAKVELTVTEAAGHARVVPATIRRWVTAGHLPARKAGPGRTSPLMIARSDLDRVIRHPPRRPPAPRARSAG